jgi:DNA-directed RNA polymerase specialized sigma24 family protein
VLGITTGKPKGGCEATPVTTFSIFKHHSFCLKSRRKEIKVKTLLADLIQMPVQPPIGSVDSEDCRTECLLKLSPDKLKLLQEYFLDVKSSKQLAEELDTTINGLRLKIHRIKKELESCFEECLKKLSGT